MENTKGERLSSHCLLRPIEVAAILNISKALAYRLLQTGQIPSVRFNRTVRVRPDDLVAYIQNSLMNNS